MIIRAIKSSTALIRDEEIIGEETEVDDQQQPDVLQTLEQLIHNTISEYDRPAGSLTKEDRLRVVQFLDGRGTFLIKGALDRVATALQVSRFSMYKYLEELRARQRLDEN